jgi:hypothetical protein
MATIELTKEEAAALADLYDSETNDRVTAEELGVTDEEYAAAVSASLNAGQPEGHVRVNGRRVYAQ